MNAGNTASFHRGFWFFFEFEGHQITCHASALSGRERVFIDDDVVIDCHSFRINSTHQIAVEGEDLSVSMSLEDMWKGIYRCELIHNGTAIARARAQLTGGLWLPFLAGTVSGVLGAAVMHAMGAS